MQFVRGSGHAAREDPDLAARVTTELAGTVAEVRLETVRGDWTAYYRNIADVLCDGADLIVKPEEAARGVRLLEAVQASLDTGETVNLR